jgi:hypothetical protein
VLSTGKYKSGEFRMFTSMAYATQNLNVCRVRSKGGFCAVRLDVMALQVLCCAAFFAVFSFRNNVGNDFSGAVFAIAYAAFPIWVRLSFWHRAILTAKDRTIRAGTSTTFANLKCFSATAACAVNQSFVSFWLKFVRTASRASIGFPPNVGVRSRKLCAASSACQCNMPTALNFPLESRHG